MAKRERQARATEAAQRYGWPTATDRDSVIEPRVAANFTTMPGSELYDPYARPNHTTTTIPQRQRRNVYDPPIYQQAMLQSSQGGEVVVVNRHQQQSRNVYERPIYQQQQHQHSQQVITRQPQPPPPPAPIQRKPVARRPTQVCHRPAPVVAQRPVIVQNARRDILEPQAARLVRRDSNGISECSSDGEESRERLRNYTVSPLNSPEPVNSPGGLYTQMGLGLPHGRGAF
ncbi:hypothetical protein GGS20DRAFT_285202 [Poronia punctata]|nr:hypothetical protein GGS20DRAFT_285202 [Poronia punctata]